MPGVADGCDNEVSDWIERRRKNEPFGQRRAAEEHRGRKKCARMDDGLAERAIGLVVFMLRRKVGCGCHADERMRMRERRSRGAVKMRQGDKVLIAESKQEKGYEPTALASAPQRESIASNDRCFSHLHQRSNPRQRLSLISFVVGMQILVCAVPATMGH
jgi:hypothetical protein